MRDASENTVSAENQLLPTDRIFFMGKADAPKRLLIIGNSITRHAPNVAGLGWHGDWGMAASSRENDYVHLLQAKLEAEGKNVLTMVRQASSWERGFANEDALADFSREHEFGADVVLFRFTENVPKDADMAEFERCYNEFIDHICPKGSQPIFTTTVWKSDVKNALTAKIAEERNAPVVDLLEIGRHDDMMAIGLFEHHGVSIHPGDKGMRYIADEIYEVLKKYI